MRSLIADLVLVRLQKETDPLLHKRLYKAIRHAILDGSLPPHSRLPPSRDLAGELKMSRNTILTVYEQLLAEGYVVSRRGSGTFVAKTLPDMFLPTGNIASKQQRLDASSQRALFVPSRATVCSATSAPVRASGELLSPAYRTSMPFPTRYLARFRPVSAAARNPSRLSYSCNGGTAGTAAGVSGLPSRSPGASTVRQIKFLLLKGSIRLST